MSSVERSAAIDAPPEDLWPVLADFGNIAAWVPMIQHSCPLSQVTDGPGAVRRVQIIRQTLVERVVAWNPPERLAYDIEGLPPVVGTARNTWTLTPVPDGGTLVRLRTEIATGRNPLKRLIAGKVLERMALASEMMLTGLAGAVDSEPVVQHEENGADA